MSEEKKKELLYKILLLGDTSVGKTCFLMRYADNTFQEIHLSTIGLDYKLKNVQIDDGKIVKIQIWDTAGQETFRSITRAYYKNSVCAILVYDISNRDSFEHISSWIEDCLAQSPKTVFMVLVGNKSDLNEKRKVTFEEGEQMARNHNLLFFESSAKTGDNVDRIFEESAKEINKKINEGYYDLESDICGIKRGLSNGPGNVVYINGGNNTNNKKCCF